MIKTISEMNDLRQTMQANLMIRQNPDAVPTMEGGRMHLLVCGGTGCTSSKSMEIIASLERLIGEHQLEDEIKVVKTGCFGLCAEGPIIMVYPDHIMYTQVQPEDAEEIFTSHIQNGKLVSRLIAGEVMDDGQITNALESVDFFNKQMRIALRNCGAINPENIDEYIAKDGYKALATALESMDPEDVVDVIKDSQLRGRGGGGFPTG
ncbi:MAG: NAD(P)H-dependent oxidoreductase subunit E, partial [Anaerovoracaceae bacterium]